MHPLQARRSPTHPPRIRRAAAVAALAALLLALSAFTATGAAAPAAVVQDPPRQAPANGLTPPALTAAVVGDDAIELRWDPVPGAVRYKLRVWWDPLDFWQDLGGDDITAAPYLHTGLVPGREYLYTIQAIGASGEKSAWQQDHPSAIVPAAPATSTPTPTAVLTSTPTPAPTAVLNPTQTPTPTPTQNPDAAASPLRPPTLTAVVVGDAIELRWDPVPGAVRYKLRVWWDPLPHWQDLEGDDITAAPYLHRGVVPGREYLYTIQAIGASGEKSAWQQDHPSATVPAAPATAAPTPTAALTATPTPTGVASPTPTPTPVLTPTPTPTGAVSPLPTPTPPLTPTTASTPPPMQTPTPTPTQNPDAAASPLRPPALIAVVVGDAIELRWDPVPGAVRYKLRVWWDPLDFWQDLEGDNITAAPYVHRGVVPGREYFYTIQAIGASGEKSAWQQDLPSATVPTATPTPTATAGRDYPPPPPDFPPPPPPKEVGPVPPSLGLHPFYRKYLDADGIPIVASANVDDAELYHASDVILAMLSNRPDIVAAMSASRFRVVIFEDDGCRGPFQVPEIRHLLSPGSCTDTAGIAARLGYVHRVTGEWFLIIEALGVAPALLPYCNFVLVHEIAHLVDYAITVRLSSPSVYDPNFEPRVNAAYNAALAAGLYPNAYAATEPAEYWAEAVTFWFLPDMLTGVVRTPAHVSKLADYDPRIVGLIREVFGDAALPACNPIFGRLMGTVTGPAGDPLAGVKVVANVRAVPRFAPYFYYFTTETLPTAADGAFVVSISKPRVARLQRLLRRDSGESDLDVLFLLGAAPGYAGACPAGYLSPDSLQVENIPARSAAQFAIPVGDLSGFPLTIAPGFNWLHQVCPVSITTVTEDSRGLLLDAHRSPSDEN